MSAAVQRAGVPITAGAWKRARFSWASAVRRDVELSTTARLLADMLAFDYANKDSARCDPSYKELAAKLGRSKDAVKRAMRELREAGWIARDAINSNRNVRVVFLSRATVSQLSSHPDFPKNGGKNAPPYIIDKPYKNHKGGNTDQRRSAVSPNSQIRVIALDVVKAVKGGEVKCASQVKPEFFDHIVAAGLLTEAELHGVGISICYEDDV